VRPLIVVAVDEVIEFRLLLQEVVAGRLGGLQLQGQMHAFMAALTPASDPSLHILRNNDDINLSRASLTIENPVGHQSMQYFSFGGVEKASIRADTTGNLVLNANSSTYYLWIDFGNPDAITIVPHNSGRTLTIDGNVNAHG